MRFIYFLMLLSVSAFSTTTYMSLPLPTVGVTLGPAWATDINQSFTIVDSHDHSPGKGVLVPVSGINVGADFPFNDYNITGLMATRYQNQGSSLTGASNVGETYEGNGELFYNDSAQNQVQITNAGHLNAASLNNNSITASQISSGAAAAGLPLTSNGSGGVSFQASTISGNIATKTSSYSMATSDTTILCDATAANVVITLATPSLKTGNFVYIKKTDSTSHICYVNHKASETIDGESQKRLIKQYQSISLTTDGTNWFLL